MTNTIKLFFISILFLSNSAFSQNSFKAIDLEEYFIGDTITLGSGNPYDTKYASIKYTGVKGDTSKYFGAMPKLPNTKTIIKRIYTNKFGEICFETLSSSNYYYRIPIDRALNKSEIKSKNPSFRTSDEAMAELKKAKEKLDLGLITKDEYDKVVIELKKYIKE
jgi:hypothetical protein